MKQYKILSESEMSMHSEYIRRVRQMNSTEGTVVHYYIQTFGCQQNVADSEKLAGMCELMGYEKCEQAHDADLIIVNTCAIREHAEKRALSIIGQFKHIKAEKPSLMIAVCGCMVAQEHRKNDIKFRYPYVDFIFSASSLFRLPELIYKRRSGGRRSYCPEETEYLVAEGIPSSRESDFKAWVSVMYGCNNFCTYCIVPYVRGRERSRMPKDIIAEVRELVEGGYKDITLLGQNVNSYGKDARGDDGEVYDFADLLADIDKIEGDYLIRFMTSHPKDASKKLIDVIASSKHIAHQFHLPLQSGSDTILEKMNRHYDTEKYMQTVEYMRQRIPDITLSSDIIVGFPTETEQDFCDTLEMLRRVRFDAVYSFIYSPRNGTPAAKMEGHVPPEVQGERFNRLLELQNEISYEKNQPLVGTTIRVLCDGESKNDPNVYSGRSEGNKIVLFDGDASDKGRFIDMRITRADTFALYGEKV